MKSLALKLSISHSERIGWAIAAMIGTLAIAKLGVTLNQSIALLFSAVVFIIWTHNKANGLMAALLFFMIKPLLMRIAYAIDKELSGSGGFDLLGITPALLLAMLIIWHLYLRISSGERVLNGRTRILLVLFSVISFLSIFNPANSVLLGFGGFERNVLPNMLVLITASFVFTDAHEARKLLKILICLGLVSCVYGIGQYYAGLYPWEKDWVVDVAFANTESGWLTVGLKGVEFRLFSFFYNYMDFTFCNALIFALAISCGTILRGKWNKLRVIYIISWIIVLMVSLERTPLMMSLLSMFIVFYLSSSVEKRKRIIWKSFVLAALLLISLSISAPFLKGTGADTLVRLTELSNPLAARSIEERLQKNWGPTLETIVANPLGVGIGYGSQTRANSIAARTNYYIEPHNELLQKTLETGVIGGTMFLLLLIAVFRDALRLGQFSGRIYRLGIGFAAASVGFWLCGMVNIPFSGSSGLLYWALAGVVVSMSESNQREGLNAAKKFDETADNSKG